MKKIFVTQFLFLFACVVTASAQVPLSQNIAILKAEDARRYDKTLEDMLKGPNADVRARAALAAGRIGNAAAIPVLAELLEKDPSFRVREMAAFALGEIESIGGAEPVARPLFINKAPKNYPASLTARLIEAAGKIAAANPTADWSETLRIGIVGRLTDELDDEAKQNRQMILLGLTAASRSVSRDAKRERPDDTDNIARLFLTNGDPEIRAQAANVLARIRAKNANNFLRKMLESDVDPVARANAARALGAAEDKESLQQLTSAATFDADSRVRVSAIRALGALRDARAAARLLTLAEIDLSKYKSEKKPGFNPTEQNEFIEVATALGRILPNTYNAKAINVFREFGKLDKGNNAEVYIARLRVAPGRGDGDKPELVSWKQYSTLGQLIGEFATLEPTTDEGKRMKSEAPDILRPLARAYAEADPSREAGTIMAAGDVLRAYAKFKPADLSEILRTALKNRDIFVRATAAELIAELPASDENIAALNREFEYAILNDTQYNDAVLGTLDALFKLDKRKSLPALELAAGSLDHLVRAKVVDLLKDAEFKNKETLPVILRNLDLARMLQVRPHSGKSIRLGQILNNDAAYRRAASRKNGSVRAVVNTQKGTFTIDLLPEDAPLTVDNFIKLAGTGYFNGLEVHRVVSNFVMQDGDPRGDGNGGPGWSIRCEINMVPHDRGAVGMALSGKDTGGSQWFVTHSPQPHLDGGYTVFGRVNETGMKVVDKIVRGDKITSIVVHEGSSTQSPRGSRRK